MSLENRKIKLSDVIDCDYIAVYSQDKKEKYRQFSTLNEAKSFLKEGSMIGILYDKVIIDVENERIAWYNDNISDEEAGEIFINFLKNLL